MRAILLVFFATFLFFSCKRTDCNNNIKDGNEFAIDCGGDCDPCLPCENGVQDGSETGVDCGGNCGTCFPGIDPPSNQQFIDLQGLWYRENYTFDTISNQYADLQYYCDVNMFCRVEFTDEIYDHDESTGITKYRATGSVGNCSHSSNGYTYSQDTLDGFYIDLLTSDSLRLINPNNGNALLFLRDRTTIMENFEMEWSLELHQPYPYSDNISIEVGNPATGHYMSVPIVPGQTSYGGTINYVVPSSESGVPNFFNLYLNKKGSYSSATDELVQFNASVSKYGVVLSEVSNAKICAGQDGLPTDSCFGGISVDIYNSWCRINWW